MQTALVSEPGETVCSFFVGPKPLRNFRDWSKSNGAVGVRGPASVYKFNPRFPSKCEFIHHDWGVSTCPRADQSYSICRAAHSATSTPCSGDTTYRRISIPAERPAD